jgi:hypothetical protein
MKKYILSTILVSNSFLSMSQNYVQTNILVVQTRSTNTTNAGWWGNESRNTSNNIAPINNRGIQSSNVVQRNNRNYFNQNENNLQSRTNTNPTSSVVRNSNPVHVQRASTNIQRGNTTNIQHQSSIDINQQNIINEDNNSPLSNGNLEINLEKVQSKQIQFLADNTQSNLQLELPELNFSFEINQKVTNKEVKVKELETSKIRTSSGIKIKTENTNSTSEKINSSNEKIKLTENKVQSKKRGNSYYSQKNKNYTGKKIKIWCKKHLKLGKKIRMSVSCPKF